ncbi:SMP-30/gluconolactonase/LRE family protein [Hyalangium gracile]|uniref:SMP-30/gluconolactonase/LRE family protein n=1 Tax=Hyalangium gracile TaxID=394092 RepID=UPI001CCA1F39|nr:hypothetical protein [Hyalangium gracile]
MNRPFWSKAVLVVVCSLLGCNDGGSSAGPVQTSGPGSSFAPKQSAQALQAPRHPDKLYMPIPDFFPEGIAHAADGTFYVGSYSTGRVLRQRPGRFFMEPFLPASTSGRGVVGMKVHDASGTLWLCEVDLAQASPSALRAYDARTGAPRGSWPFPPGGGCNDLTLDPRGNVYATDAYLGAIRRLRRGAPQLETWATDPSFMAPPGYPGLNGIAWDSGSIAVVKYDSGDLFRIPIQADGSAGTHTRITTDAPIGYPDGILVQSPGVLLVLDNDNGRFLRVELSGDTGHVSLLASGFDNPTTLALHDGDAFIVESQFDHYFGIDPSPPDLPFRVKRVWLRP